MSLRETALKGGMFLAGRQALGMALGLIGIVLITRIIGPQQYGFFAACVAILGYIRSFASLGIDVYLVRKPGDLTQEDLNQAFSFLLVVTTVFGVGLYILRDPMARALGMPEVGPLFGVLALTVPFSLIHVPAMAQMDRALAFKQSAVNEVLSQALQYLVAVPLALTGAGAWSLVAGWMASTLSMCVLTYRSAGYRPGFHWDRTLVRQMLGYGIAFSSSIWVWQLRLLVNPVVVGRFAGAEAVGYVALAIRICEMLSFAKGAVWRVSIAALSRMANDAERLRKSINEGMRLQAISVALPLAAFAILAPFAVHGIFGEKWDPVVQVYPFISVGYLANSLFNLHSSVLYVLRENWSVTIFHAAHVILFAGSAMLLVPSMNIFGYGWAEIAALGSYVLIHSMVQRRIGSPSYAGALIWFLSGSGAIVLGARGAPAAYFAPVVMLVPLLLPAERASLLAHARLLLPKPRT